jgi:hypothetical protein
MMVELDEKIQGGNIAETKFGEIHTFGYIGIFDDMGTEIKFFVQNRKRVSVRNDVIDLKSFFNLLGVKGEASTRQT